MKSLFTYLLSVVVLISITSCQERGPQNAKITIDPLIRFQVMTGWEATAQIGEHFSGALNKYQGELIDKAVNDLGINRIRLEIYSGVENPVDSFALWQSGKIKEEEFNSSRFEVVNDNSDPLVADPKGFQFSMIDSTIEAVVLPMRKQLELKGESLYVNLNFVDFGKDRGTSDIRHNNNPEEYAEFMLAAFTHIKSKYGFVPNAIEVILEPDNHTGWTGTQIGEAIVATANRLKEHGFSPGFIVPSTTNASNAPIFIDEIAKVPGAMKYISEFSYHRYCCASDEVLGRISDRTIKYKKKSGMLEMIGADYKMLHQDIRLGNASSWQQFVLAGLIRWGNDNGGAYFVVDDSNESKPTIKTGSRTAFLRQYFRFIRAGAQRIGLQSTNSNFDPLAFVNTDGKYVVVIKSDVHGTIGVQGLPSGWYGMSYTTAAQTDVSIPEASLKKGEILNATIPAPGVITIYGKESGAAKK